MILVVFLEGSDFKSFYHAILSQSLLFDCFCSSLFFSFLSVSSLLIWRASLVAQMVKNLPAVQETQVQSMGGEDPLEKGMVTHSSILSWRIPWTEELGGLQSMGLQRVRHNWETKAFTKNLTFGLPKAWAACNAAECIPGTHTNTGTQSPQALRKDNLSL